MEMRKIVKKGRKREEDESKRGRKRRRDEIGTGEKRKIIKKEKKGNLK